MMKKAKFTVIDALIIIMVIAVLLIAALKFFPGLISQAKTGEAEFTILVSDVDEGTGDIIKVGENVLISFSELAYAEVTNVVEEPYIKYELNNITGQYVKHIVEGKSNLKISVKCAADVTDTRIQNGEVPIRVGAEMPVRGKGYTVKGYVIELEDKQNDN